MDEFVVDLANGWSIRSGWSEGGVLGDYVRIVDEYGVELVYWDHQEWVDDPVLVMGAILGASQGVGMELLNG